MHAGEIRITRKYTNESRIETFASRNRLLVCIEDGYVMISVVIMLPQISINENNILLKTNDLR